MKTYLLITIAHAVLSDIERAKADGVVTVEEVITIAADTAKRVCKALGIENHAVFGTPAQVADRGVPQLR